MGFASAIRERTKLSSGFSLIELSIVVAILSVISVLGLEVATSFLTRNAYISTKDQLVAIDQAIDAFYRTYGRLPCPAPATNIYNTTYGAESCPATAYISTPVTDMAGGYLPFRTLNLPSSMAVDSYGSVIYYFVTASLTTGSFATANAGIEIRSGQLLQPCNTGTCSVLADPGVTSLTGAAYAVLSVGADQRGGYTKLGKLVNACAGTSDARIDAQNCFKISNSTGSLLYSPPVNVLYDSRYNPGTQTANYFDDIIVWRAKGRL